MDQRVVGRDRPFRFGILATGSSGAAAWIDQARRAEGDGCSTLLVGDHYLTPQVCTARLAMAAAVTTALRLGSYVYCNDFRHPALHVFFDQDFEVLRPVVATLAGT